MSLELILIELLVGAMILGFLGSYKKRILDRAVLLATVPLAFLISVLACKRVSGAIGSLISESVLSADMPEAISSAVGALIVSLSGPFAAFVLFIVLLIAFRIVAGIALSVIHTVLGTKRRERRAKKKGKKKSLLNKLATGAIGAVSGFLVCMLSFLPFAYVNDLTEPIIATATSEELEGTYVNEVAVQLDTLGMPFSDGSVLSGVATATGIRGIYNTTIKGLTDTSVTLSSGREVEFNSLELVNSISSEGVRLLALYEESCDSEATFKDFKPAGNVLRALSGSDLLMTLTADVLAKLEAQPLPEDADFGAEMMYFVSTEYTSGDAEVIRNEISALAALIELFADDLGDVSIEGNELMTSLLAYMEDESSSNKMVDTIASSTLYNEGFPLFMEFGLELICDQMNLSENKEDDYRRYLADMQAAFNDKSIAVYDRDLVETFIKYCAGTGTSPSEYSITDPANKTEIDRGYESYVSFFASMKHIETVFTDYSVSGTEYLWSTYVCSDGGRYYYFGEDFAGTAIYDKWVSDIGNLDDIIAGLLGDAMIDELLGGQTVVPDPVSVAASRLAHELNSFDAANPGAVITEQDIRQMAESVIGELSGESDLASAVSVLESLIGIDGYTAAPAYHEDIIKALNRDAALENDKVAANISGIAALFNNFTKESDVASFDTVMSHFSEVGAMIDGLGAMEMTADIPGKMLDVMLRDKNYGKYFRLEPIKHKIDDARAGTITYEQLFTEVATAYGELNSAMGNSGN